MKLFLSPLTLTFLLAELLVVQYHLLNTDYLQHINFTNLLWSWNVEHAEISGFTVLEQESPAIADKPARRESLPKIAPIRHAYNVVADNTGLSSFV